MDSFPVDDATLLAIEHALGGAYTVDEDGTHHLVGADYSFDQLLDFIGGTTGEDPDGHDDEEYPDIWVDTRIHYTKDDIIRALIEEVRRLRAA